MNGKPGNPRMIRPANQIKLRMAAKAPEKVDARATAAFRAMKITPPPEMNRSHKLTWYIHRITTYQRGLDRIADRQHTYEMTFTREAKESPYVDSKFIHRMIPKAKRILQMELQLHRMEMYKTMLHHHANVEKTPLSPAEERKRINPVERTIRSYKRVEDDMIRVLNDPKELEKRTRQMIIESRKKPK